MIVSPMWDDGGLLGPRKQRRAGDLPHMKSDAFRALWNGASVSYQALRDEGVSVSDNSVVVTVCYTDRGTIHTTIRSPRRAVGTYVGIENDTVVAAVEVSVQ